MTDTRRAPVDVTARATRDLEAIAHYCRHDFLSPIRTVQLGMDLIFDSTVDPEDREALVEHVRDAAKLLGNVAARLDEYFRITKGPAHVLDLREVMTTGVLVVSRKVGAKTDLAPTVESIRSITDDLAGCSGDPTLLGTMFVELFDNAVRHGGTAPTVEVGDGGGADGGRHIAVRDAGRGFPTAAESNAMVELLRSGAGQGAGVGLALARRIAELHDGRLSVDSEAGHGTTIHVVLR